MMNALRWLGRNIGALILSFLLAALVWVSAVLGNDPNQTRPLSRALTIEYYGKDPNLKLMGEIPTAIILTLMAPQSVWEKLESDPSTIRAWVDLSSLQAGEYVLPVQVDIYQGLVRLVSKEPEQVTVVLEPLVSEVFPISMIITGELPLGYERHPYILEPSQATISGPQSLVQRVKEVRAQVDIAGITETLTKSLAVTPVDENGKSVSGITTVPSTISFTQPVVLLGGYRNVIVKVVTIGNVASGYRLTNYFVSPSSVILFSSDPQLFDSLPGYVDTEALDLTDANDDFEALLELNLPPGITAVTDSKVLVQVSIAAIESSLTISLPVEITGLVPGYEVLLSPSAVDVLLNGPVPVLNDLKPSDIRVKVDLSGFGEGVFQVIPVVDFLPPKVQKVSVLPATVEVTIKLLPTATLLPMLTLTPTPVP